eukprot:TRINITY_DN26192_c0_g1_i1.p1 TRINITY_DN26192_c0_g1~~TRINITY_DN26192_c0_g1_i1.p1  ORF type:complete len:118 (-),score=41.30 TRINITY_DN26192_c0_g1_i1:253-606(-)
MANRSLLASLMLAAAVCVVLKSMVAREAQEAFVGIPAGHRVVKTFLQAAAPDDLKVRETDIGFEEDYGKYQPGTYIRPEDKKDKKEENIFAVMAMPLFYWFLACGGVAAYMNVFYQG